MSQRDFNPAHPSAVILDGGHTERLSRVTWCALIGLATALRLAWALWVPVVPVSDGKAYEQFARNLASGVGYAWTPGSPTAYWPVGTSFVYSLLFRAFGARYEPIVALNILVGIAIVALATELARRGFGARAAVFTGLIVACWPVLIEYTTILASELLFLLAVLAAWLAWTLSRHVSILGALASGVCLAAAALVRPTALAIPAIWAVGAVYEEPRWRPVLTRVTLVVLVMAACIAPWTYRNYRVFGELVLVSTNSGPVFWMDNKPPGAANYPEGVGTLPEPERSRRMRAMTWQYIRAHPLAYVRNCAHRAFKLLAYENTGIAWNDAGLNQRVGSRGILLLKVVSSAYWWFVLAAAAVGMIYVARKQGLLALLLNPTFLFVAFVLALHIAMSAQDRYHLPCNPFLAMWAGLTLSLRPWLRAPASLHPADQNFAATSNTATNAPTT